MSRTYFTEPEPARRMPARVSGAAMTSEAMTRAFIERVMGKRTDDDDKPIVVPDDEPVEDEPEPEQVEDEPAETLEAGLNYSGGTLFGVSSEELARMRAKQADEARRKQANMRAAREL